jgi:hypothetical protein
MRLTIGAPGGLTVGLDESRNVVIVEPRLGGTGEHVITVTDAAGLARALDLALVQRDYLDTLDALDRETTTHAP